MTVEIAGLKELSRSDSAWTGTKAAYLGDLLQAGFAVPDGFAVVPHPGQLSANWSRESNTARAISEARALLGDGPVAVRSSAVDEDLEGTSYAGQYETFLGVGDDVELLDAIEKCVASARSQRVTVYERQRGRMGSGRMAVLVQRQVPADAAGIAFTANPLTGERSEILIDAITGLGEQAASGEATPQQWLVRTDGTVEFEGAATLTEDHARAVADLARQVEEHFGTPQDVEWAIAGDELYLLQARPITALPQRTTPVPVEVEVPEGYWQRDASHAPKPNSPLYRSLVLPYATEAGKAWFDEYGYLADGLEWQEIGGWQYISLRPLGGKERKPPPDWLMPLLTRVVPQLRNRVKRCVEAVRSDRAQHNLDSWYNEWKPELRSRAQALLDVHLAELGDAELGRHLETVSHLIRDALRIHFILHGAFYSHLAELTFACRDLLGWEDRETLDLLSGLSGTSTEPAAKLTELGRVAASNPRLLEQLGQEGQIDHEGLTHVDADFATALDDYQRAYGYRALRYELIDPTLNETPELLIRLICDQVASGFDPDAVAREVRQSAEQRLAQATNALSGRPRDNEAFRRALDRAQAAYPVREDNEFFTINLPLGVARLAALELGRRLVERGQIEDRDDIFYIEFIEARSALRSGDPQHSLVELRKGERAWVEAHPGPGSYGVDPGPPPSFAALPNEARFAMEALFWAVDRTFETERSAQRQAEGEALIAGVAASPGSYRGSVRLVMDETQFDKIEPGDVMVCPITSPVWSVLFPSIGALVADTGGILSHPAIIAREYRIPAVVAAGNATELLADGQIVTVNGSTGVVELQTS